MDTNQDPFDDVASTYKRKQDSAINSSELSDLWRIARTALDCPSRYDRMQYVLAEYCKRHTEAKRKQVWLTIDSQFKGYGHS